MIARNLTRRLERLEDALLPDADPLFFQIVIVGSDGKRVPGEQIGPIHRRASRAPRGDIDRTKGAAKQRCL
jgi:hypothetical protein